MTTDDFSRRRFLGRASALALLGIAGGGAILIGVLLMVSGLGFHHEVRRDRGTARGL